MCKRMMRLMLCAVLAVALFTLCVSAADVVIEGACGENAEYVLDSEGVLTISGTGAMYDYEDLMYIDSSPPWYSSGMRGHRDYEYNLDILQIIIEPGITHIGTNAFARCLNCESVSIAYTVSSIGDFAFQQCTSLRSVSLPEGLQNIGEQAFTDCQSLTHLSIPQNITHLPYAVFSSCIALESVSFPEGLQEIGDNAFSNCANLKGIIFPKNLKSIGPAAFAFSGISNFILPDGLTHVGRSAFMGTPIYTITIPESVTMLDSYSLFQSCSNLTSVKLPSSVTRLDDLMFSQCHGLVSVEIPDGIEEIGYNTFGLCYNLESVTLPESITTIGEDTFRYSHNLSSVYFEGNAPELLFNGYNIGPFDDCDDDLTLYYPAGAEGWTTPEWNGYKTQPYYKEQKPVEIDKSKYENQRETRSFKIKNFADNNHCSTAFTVTVGDEVFRSEDAKNGVAESWWTNVHARIPQDYTGDVLIECEGFHSWSMPIALTANYNYISMTPSTVTDPFPQTLLVDVSSSNWKNLRNVFQDSLGCVQASVDAPASVIELYPLINWNGHGQGNVWLQQGNRTLSLRNGEYNTVCLPDAFVLGGGIYLCAQAADGTTVSHLTRLSVVTSAKNTLPIDTGDTADADTSQTDQENVGLFSGTTFSMDLSLLEGTIPISLEFGENNTFEAAVGVKVNKADDKRAVIATCKESIRQIANASGNIKNQQRLTSDFIEAINELGYTPDPSYGRFAIETNIQVLGYINGKIVDNMPKVTGGKIVFVLKGEASYTYNTVITVLAVPVPSYFKVAAEAAISTYTSLQYDDEGKYVPPERDTPLDGSLAVSAAAGPGWEGTASIGIEGQAALGVHTTFPIKKADTALTVQVGLNAVGTLLGQEVKVCLTPMIPEYVFWRAGEFTWEKYSAGYALRSGGTTYYVNQSRSTMTRALAMEGTIASGVSGYSAPTLGSLSDGRLVALWPADDNTRGIADKNALYYSIRTGGLWSEPRQVLDDGTLDAAPQLYNYGGELWLIWQNYTRSFGETLPDYDTLAAQVDIAVARFDEQTEAFVQTGDLSREGYDCLPQLLESDGMLTAAWTNGDSACSFAWNGTHWEPLDSVPENYQGSRILLPEDYPYDWPAMASAPKVINGNGIQAVLYIAPDGNGVNNLFGIFHDGFGWGEGVQLTALSQGSSIGGFSALAESTGITVLVLQRELDEELNITDASIKLLELEHRIDLAVEHVDYEAMTMVPGHPLAVRAQVRNLGSATANAVCVILSDGTDELSRQELGIQILPGQTREITFLYPLPQELEESMQLQVLPLSTDDADETDNEAPLCLRLADISVESLTVSHDSSEARVEAALFNLGQTDLTDIRVEFRLDDENGTLLETVQVDSMAPGSPAAIAMSDTSGLKDGDMIYAEAITDQVENLIGNNSAIALLTVPEKADPDFVPTNPNADPPETIPPETTPPETSPPETTPPESSAPTEPPHTHSYGQWTVIQEPTGTTEGTEQRSCDCGQIQTRPIAVLANPFTDLKNTAYYYNPVLWAVKNGITSGITTTTFVPGGECTRAQFVTFLWRASGCPEPEILRNPFTDLRKGAYYEKAVLWAVEEGITKGLSATQFSPEGTCTRGQVVTFLHRWSGSPAPSNQTHSFTDLSVDAFYYKPVLWAVHEGITAGITTTSFAPSQPCTRGQVVTFLYRAITQ